ncbi:hypothetical protein NDU88_001920 [Pleurodeles waltl]|uniref:Uncharacterized protein n=1 Tax=Pleurodeles waltl TaxID=8319 RepID=A0AAV7RBR9_PLEWA|nr:hypothetical protein NDU88_001920 [Pleurodeles waltl]
MRYKPGTTGGRRISQSPYYYNTNSSCGTSIPPIFSKRETATPHRTLVMQRLRQQHPWHPQHFFGSCPLVMPRPATTPAAEPAAPEALL